jgi:hypothetical protein
MRTASEHDLLDLWERGQSRHPIDRALLLSAWARPEIAPEELARLPLGVVNAGLLRMRRALFGPQIDATVACEQCGEVLAIRLDIAQLLEAASDAAQCGEVESDGFRFRLPDSRDLAAISVEQTVEAAADHLLERCCLARPAKAVALSDIRETAERLLEATDPLADLRLGVVCEACGHDWPASLHPPTLLWDDIRAFAHGLLGQVHALARAYGWTEADVLALTPQRRALYLRLVDA